MAFLNGHFVAGVLALSKKEWNNHVTRIGQTRTFHWELYYRGEFQSSMESCQHDYSINISVNPAARHAVLHCAFEQTA